MTEINLIQTNVIPRVLGTYLDGLVLEETQIPLRHVLVFAETE